MILVKPYRVLAIQFLRIVQLGCEAANHAYSGRDITPSFSGYDDDYDDALLDDNYDALGFDLEFVGWDSGSND